MSVMIVVSIIALVILMHCYLYMCNPFSRWTIFKQPYSTSVRNGKISYRQNYQLKVYGTRIASAVGYYRSGFLIVSNTFFGGKPINLKTEKRIIAEIHRRRFDPRRPYLISGDQFSVLYPRNLGVFYNQLTDNKTALNKKDATNRQRIYLQSILIAIDGLSASDVPKTTIVPIGRKSAVLTQVHPGGVGSDQVYGLLYAIDMLSTQSATKDAISEIINDRSSQLKFIIHSYLAKVRDPETRLIRAGLHMSSARDGVIRSSSFYDNVILWKTLQLAARHGLLKSHSAENSLSLQKLIKQTFWNRKMGYYNDDINQSQFSADYLIGYPTQFFDLKNKIDLQRTKRTVEYIEASGLASPFPIKYQNELKHDIPFIVKLIVPTYGSTAIWSYWGSQYITLLADMYDQTKEKRYRLKALEYAESYSRTITRDGGFAETFNEDGLFMKRGIYKSIRVTGWVVQYEHAIKKLGLKLK